MYQSIYQWQLETKYKTIIFFPENPWKTISLACGIQAYSTHHAQIKDVLNCPQSPKVLDRDSKGAETKLEAVLEVTQDPMLPGFSAARYPAPQRHHKQPADPSVVLPALSTSTLP